MTRPASIHSRLFIDYLDGCRRGGESALEQSVATGTVNAAADALPVAVGEVLLESDLHVPIAIFHSRFVPVRLRWGIGAGSLTSGLLVVCM